MAPPARRERPSRIRLFVKRWHKQLLTAFFLLIAITGIIAVISMTTADNILLQSKKWVESVIPLKVTEVRITGNTLTSRASVLKALGTEPGQPMLPLDVNAARARIDALSFVDHSSVERHLPGLVIIKITERPPFAVWQNNGQFSLIDRNGATVPDKEMTEQDAKEFLHLPLVVGTGANTTAAALIDAIQAEPEVLKRFRAATRVGERRWTLTMNNGTTIFLPEGAEVAALRRLAALQKSMSLLDRPVRLIDLRLPDRMTIQPYDHPQEPDQKTQDNDGEDTQADMPDTTQSTPPAPPKAKETPETKTPLSSKEHDPA